MPSSRATLASLSLLLLCATSQAQETLPQEANPLAFTGKDWSATFYGVADIGYVDSTCPYCKVALSKRPKRKAPCPHCGNIIFVRMRPVDRLRVLLTEQQTFVVEGEWMALQAWSQRGRRKK